VPGPLLNRTSRAVFLCYHSVAPEGPRYLTVSADLFERQLRTLRDRGFVGGDGRALEALAAGERTPPTVFLTFDDGFRDNHETVMPLLEAYGMRAFVFVIPPLVDAGAPLLWPEVESFQREFPGTMVSVDWEMVGQMAEGPFEIGSHTLTHPHLASLHGDALRDELLDSRRRVIERLGRCDTIAYPFGSWSSEVETATREAGYRFAFTLPTGIGQRHGTLLSIPRVNVDYRDEERRFAFKLSSAGRRLLLSRDVEGTRKAFERLARRGSKGAQ
jgi:peptidoglycan/xylan/chitin deacetylase (PgdA/CDA1 family)